MSVGQGLDCTIVIGLVIGDDFGVWDAREAICVDVFGAGPVLHDEIIASEDVEPP